MRTSVLVFLVHCKWQVLKKLIMLGFGDSESPVSSW